MWKSKDKHLKYEKLSQGPKSSKIKIVKSYSDVELVDRWYVRFISLLFAPLYAVLKIYDLLRFIRRIAVKALDSFVYFIVFVFLFGWFWRTRLFKHFKKLAFIRKLIKLKVHYHVLNLFSGALQGYFMSLIIPVSPAHQSYLNLASLILASLTVILSLASRKIHCFCLLLLPILASKHGRRFILVVLMTSLLTGPGANMKNNTRLITSQMNCIAEKAKNMSDVLTDAVEERYQRLQGHVVEVKEKAKRQIDKIQQNVLEVKQKVERKHAFLLNVARKINEFSDKCAETMDKLNNKCKNVFKTCGKDKRSAETLMLNYNPPDKFNLTDNKLFKEEVYHNKSSTGLFDTTQTDEHCTSTEFSNDTNPLLTLLPELPSHHLIPLANSSLKTSNASVIPELPHADLSKEDSNNTADIDKEEQDEPYHVYYVNKSRYISHPHNGTLHTGKVFHVRTRRNIFDFIVCFFKGLFSIILRPICDIIFNSIAFLCKIPKLVTHFITSIMLKKLYYLEETVKKNAWIEVDANMTFDRQVVEVRSAKKAAEELEQRLIKRFSFSPFLFLGIADYLKIISMILVYWKTYRYLSTYQTNSSFDNLYIDRYLIKHDRQVEASIFPLRKSDSEKYAQMTQLAMTPQEYFVATRGTLKAVAYIIFIAAMEGGDKMLQTMIHLMHRYGPIRVEHFIDVKDLNEIEAISTNTSRIHLLFDTKSCFSEPITPAVSRTGYHFALGGVIVLISLTQVYFLRLRHAICDSFHRPVRKRRVEFLHTKILKSRHYNIKHAAETLFAKISTNNKLQRIFPWLFKTACTICNGHDNLERCNECDTVYCRPCLKSLDQKCKICEDIVFKRRSSMMMNLESD